MTLSTEILVHASAPSRGPDDARYRKEAQGLLGFEPVKRLDLLPEQWQDESASSVPERLLSQGDDWIAVQRPIGPPRDLPSSLIETLEKATPYRASPSDIGIDTSVIPLPPFPCTSKIKAAVPLSAITSPPKLHVERTPALPCRRTTPTAIAFSETVSSPCHSKSNSWRTPPSVIPDSQPTGSPAVRLKISSSPCRKRASQSSPSSSSKQVRELQNRKRRHGQLKSDVTSAGWKGADSDEPLVPLSSREIAQEKRHPDSYKEVPLEIHPPRPYPSTAHYSTHLTPPLRTLSRTLPLADLFKPSFQTRSLDKLERGHWYIQIKDWDEVRKAKFWQFLTIFISEGRAGWGVWCSKEVESDSNNTGSSKENRDPEAMREVVKVYCWGEVVREVWLMLWLASAKRILNTGARWVDAQGETVFEMI